MFEKDLVAIDINEERIAILVGQKYKILDGIILETPSEAYSEDKIFSVEKLTEVIKPFIEKKAKVNDCMFVVRGSDIVSRHVTMPMAKEEAMRDSVEFELKQFVGDRIEEFYFDYEVIHYDKNENNGNANVLIVAVLKEKIDAYIDLGRALKLNVKAIDIYANACARVFRNLKNNFNKKIKSSGVLCIDGHSNSMIITEWNKLNIEKYQSYGLYQSTDKYINNLIEYKEYLESIDLIEVREEEEKYDRFFKSLVDQYNSLIQFYTSGKVKKNLDRIYVLGSSTMINGVEQFLEVSFNTKVSSLPSFNDLKSSVKAPKKINLKDYFYAYGLLLRKE